MSFDHNYFSADHNEYYATSLTKAGRGFLRIVLLFGSAALAMALIIVPVLNDQAQKTAAQSVLPDGVDRTMTGSIKRDTAETPQMRVQTQMPRKSMPQPKPASGPVCVIEVNGSHHGDC